MRRNDKTTGAEVRDAIAPGRLDLGDRVLEAAIRQTFANGRVEIRRLNADHSPTGDGAVTGF
jgi:DNA-binding GntR family transcriptional regulator